MYTELKAGDHTYKLRLTNQGIVQYEKEMGESPLQMFMRIDEDIMPKITDMTKLLHTMLQTYEHGITLKDAGEILDGYIEDGNTYYEDFMLLLIDALQTSGFLPKNKEEDPGEEGKN